MTGAVNAVAVGSGLSAIPFVEVDFQAPADHEITTYVKKMGLSGPSTNGIGAKRTRRLGRGAFVNVAGPRWPLVINGQPPLPRAIRSIAAVHAVAPSLRFRPSNSRAASWVQTPTEVDNGSVASGPFALAAGPSHRMIQLAAISHDRPKVFK